jgi:hypothetical protein
MNWKEMGVGFLSEAAGSLGQLVPFTDAAQQNAALQSETTLAIEAVRMKYQPGIQVLEEHLADLEKDLQAHLRQHRAILFDSQDRVPMPHRLLIHTIETVIHKASGVLATLKDRGHRDTIKVLESVDWDAPGKWSEEQLTEVGTKRKPLETFGYEVKGS